MADTKYYFPNPHLPHNFLLVNSGRQTHLNYGRREIGEILDGESFENQNQFVVNFMHNTGLEIKTPHSLLKDALLCLPYSDDYM